MLVSFGVHDNGVGIMRDGLRILILAFFTLKLHGCPIATTNPWPFC